MNRRSFLRNLPLLTIVGITTPSLLMAKESSMPEGYITPRAENLRKEIDNTETSSAKQSEQMIDELLDNCNPTAEQFDTMFDRCVISARSLYRLAADGFRMKK